MAVIRLDPKKLSERIRADGKGAPKAVTRAMVSGAQRAKAFLVGESPVDRGILRNAWKVIKLSNGGVSLQNDQPYAGVMERGARPFKISKEGREALAAWVMRKILNGSQQISRAGRVNTSMLWKVNATVKSIEHAQNLAASRKARVRGEFEDEAMRIAWAISKNFEKVGIKGKFFVRDAIPYLTYLMTNEVERYLIKFFNRPTSRSQSTEV